MSVIGTNQTPCDVHSSVAIEGKSDIAQKAQSVEIAPSRTQGRPIKSFRADFGVLTFKDHFASTKGRT